MGRFAGFLFGLGVWLCLAFVPIGEARAGDPQPPPNETDCRCCSCAAAATPNAERCDAIEGLEADYPASHFTKLDAAEATALLNAVSDPSNSVVTFYSVPFPLDPSYMVVHGYTVKGCWAAGWQMPADQFEKIIHGGEI